MKADAELRSDVEAGLAWDPAVASPHVHVAAAQGVATPGVADPVNDVAVAN